MTREDKMNVGWGIIGCGNIAGKKIAPAISAASNAQLMGVMSRDPEKGDRFARKHRASKAYHALDAFLSNPEIEAVYIATPPFLHREQTVKTAQAGKHILCDKPMAMNSIEAKEMIKASKDNGVNLMIGFMMHFHSCSLRAKQLIKEEVIGKVVVADAQISWLNPPKEGAWRYNPKFSGGGCLMDSGCHAIDLLTFLLGDIVEVSAFVDNVTFDYPVEDTVVAVLRFAKGGYAFLNNCFSTNGDNKLFLYGNKGRLTISGALGTGPKGKIEGIINGKKIEEIIHSERREYPVTFKDPYISEIEHFSKVILEATKPIMFGEEGLKNMRIVEAIYQSGKSGKRVEIRGS